MQPQAENKMAEQQYIITQISKTLHIFAMAYIVGESFTVFNLGPLQQLSVGGGASYIVEMTMLTIVFITGILSAFLRLHSVQSGSFGRKKWLLFMILKFVFLIFLTPVTDLIVMKWSRASDMKSLTGQQIYFIKSIKFLLVLISFTLGIYSRIYREDITKNFT